MIYSKLQVISQDCQGFSIVPFYGSHAFYNNLPHPEKRESKDLARPRQVLAFSFFFAAAAGGIQAKEAEQDYRKALVASV